MNQSVTFMQIQYIKKYATTLYNEPHSDTVYHGISLLLSTHRMVFVFL